jgi:3-hydroxyisobutyrate dehydrogenase
MCVIALQKGATLLLCSTVPSTYALSVQDQLNKLGRDDIHFIDAPVSGGAARSAGGTLSIMAGASPQALEKGKFLLEEASDKDKLFLCGDVGAGSNMKMVHQVLAGIHILAASEAMGFAARLGLDAKEVREKVISSDAWSWMFENRAPRMLEEDYFPGVSALTIILKDVGIITTTARLHSFPVPMTSAAEQQYVAGLGRGFGPNDDAGMVRMYYPDPVAKVKGSDVQQKPLDNDPLSKEKPPSGLELVLMLLKTIHIIACAEAVSLAHFLNVDMEMYFRLVRDAAGGSKMFERYAADVKDMLDGLEKSEGKGQDDTVNRLAKGLEMVMKEARRVECPLFLGVEALNLLLLARRRGYGDSGPAAVAGLWGRR